MDENSAVPSRLVSEIVRSACVVGINLKCDLKKQIMIGVIPSK